MSQTKSSPQHKTERALSVDSPHIDLELSMVDPEGLSTFDLVAGTLEFYEDPDYYDYEFKDRREDVDFYTARYLEVEGWSLELGVGTGRIAAQAARAGAKVVGLDLHEGMLKVAERRRAEMSKDQRSRFRLREGDMRTFDLGETFSLITLPFNALQHLYTLDDARAFLR